MSQASDNEQEKHISTNTNNTSAQTPFNFIFPFNLNGNSPSDLFFGNQLTDNLFHFATNPLQSPNFNNNNDIDNNNNNNNGNNNNTPFTDNTLANMNSFMQQISEQQKNINERKKSDLPLQQQQQTNIPTTNTIQSPNHNLFNFINNNNNNNSKNKKRPSTSDFDNTVDKKQKNTITSSPILNEPANHTVFTIIVGGKTFRLSWESLKSDGPNNFFIDYFLKQKNNNARVMYIDRDSETFQLVVHHLRGYYIRPKDDLQNQDLTIDAKYYGLRRLQEMLKEFLYVNVGGRVFRISWDLLKKGGRNFFTGPLLGSLFDPHDGKITPVYIDRDPDIFADIINHLRGYTIHIKDERHRKNLLKDAQYYLFKQLVEKLLAARTTVDGFGVEGSPEVLLLLQDVRVINILPTKQQQQQPSELINPSLSLEQHNWHLTQLQYKRDEQAHALLVQVADFCLQVHYPENSNNDPLSTLTVSMSIGENDISKLKLINQFVSKESTLQSKKLYLDEACAITVDDHQTNSLLDLQHQHCYQLETCQKCTQPCKILKLILVRGICGIHLLNDEIVLCAVRLETISSRLQLNMKREFIPS